MILGIIKICKLFFLIKIRINNVGNVYYFTKNEKVLDSVTEMYKYNNFYVNDINTSILNNYAPKHGLKGCGNTELGREYGITTFSRQTLFYTGSSFNKKSSFFSL